MNELLEIRKRIGEAYSRAANELLKVKPKEEKMIDSAKASAYLDCLAIVNDRLLELDRAQTEG